MNIRPLAIEVCLNTISKIYSHIPLNVVEIGCMFKEDEGLSTQIIAECLSSREFGGQLISIDYNKEHIVSCKKILENRNPTLLENIDFFQGNTLDILPNLFKGKEEFHFFLIDGGAQPETCLVEFECAMDNLADDGLILIDDSRELPPSKLYWLPRPFGKATLILPMLIINNYMKNREDVCENNQYLGKDERLPKAYFIEQMNQVDYSIFEDIPFKLLGNCGQMLLVGRNNEVLIELYNSMENRIKSDLNKSSILQKIFHLKNP